VAAVLLISAGGAQAFTIYVDQLANALKRSPVQTLGHSPNTISTADAARLSRLVARRDPGRIYIAVVPVLTGSQAGQLAQDLANLLNRDGVFIVIGGYNYHVTTTWGSGDHASTLLGNATGHQGDSLRVQLRKTIDAFAAADKTAGHPGAASPSPAPPKKQGAGVKSPSAPTSTSSSGGSGTTSTPIVTQPAPVSINQNAPHKSSSSHVGVIVLVAALGLLVLAAVIWGGIYLRTSMRVSHRRHERVADVHADTQKDFVKLGEQIGALDIDSEMPNASAEAKAEYAAAIDCYQEAEKRLKQETDEYQFERAQDEIRKGLLHVSAAAQMFNPSAEQTAAAAGLGSSSTAAAEPSQPAPPALPSAPPPVSAANSDDDSTVSEIAKLASLHQRGVLTDAEFEAEKQKLIGD
jgi:hypothetical protein